MHAQQQDTVLQACPLLGLALTHPDPSGTWYAVTRQAIPKTAPLKGTFRKTWRDRLVLS